MNGGHVPRRMVIAKDDQDWAAWQAANQGAPPAARIARPEDADGLAGLDPTGWVVEVAGNPDRAWLSHITHALKRHGFTVPSVFRGGFPYR